MTRIVAEPVRIALECNVTDTIALWDAAAGRAARDFGMAPDDVIDTIGPREDPEIEACVAMLFDGFVRAGDAFDACRITVLRPTTIAVPAPTAWPRANNGAATPLSPIQTPRGLTLAAG